MAFLEFDQRTQLDPGMENRSDLGNFLSNLLLLCFYPQQYRVDPIVLHHAAVGGTRPQGIANSFCTGSGWVWDLPGASGIWRNLRTRILRSKDNYGKLSEVISQLR